MATLHSLRRQAELQDALLMRTAEASLRSFVEQAWPILEPDQMFIPNWHIDLLCEHLEAVSLGHTRQLLINMPPRYMKSLLVSVLWPAWEWIRRPGGRWLFASYSDSLASKHSTDRRTLVQSAWYQSRWGDVVQLSPDQNVKSEFQNTRRGVMVATSIGGSITGKGGNRIVVDDPHNPTQVESDVQREAALTYYRRTLSTRLDNKKTDAVVVIMQRLHERDFSAYCLELGFTHVCLPAEAEISTRIVMPRSQRVISRATGETLWPSREGPEELARQRVILGSAAYAGQYQQRPAPAGGLIFQKGWWKFYDELPKLSEFAQSWDMSFKGTDESDFVVGLMAGRRGADIYLIDRVKGRWDFTETCRQVALLAQKYPRATMKLVEDAANGTAVVNVLCRRIPGMLAVKPEGGKISRAQAAQPLVEAGNVYLPNPRPRGVLIPEREWVDDFMYQCSVFPRGVHDDDVDAFTQLVARWQQPEYVCRVRSF